LFDFLFASFALLSLCHYFATSTTGIRDLATDGGTALSLRTVKDQNATKSEQAHKQDLKMEKKLAFFFDEGDGYLFVKWIGNPTQGQTMLVRSVADDKLYVRKVSFPESAKKYVGPCLDWTEVGLYRPHPQIPKLIDWKTTINRLDATTTMTSTISTYCNGGDLEHFLLINDILPTAMIWHILERSLTVLHCLHYRCQPGIGHNDFHPRNIFLEWNDANRLPEILLGDFGNAQTLTFCERFAQSTTQSWKMLCEDYDGLHDTMSRIVKQQQKFGGPVPNDLKPLLEKLRRISAGMDSNASRHPSLMPYDAMRQEVNALLNAVRVASRDNITLYRKHGTLICNKAEEVSNRPDLATSEEQMSMLHPQPLGQWNVVQVDPKTFEVVKIREEVNEGFCYSNRRKFEQSRRYRIIRGCPCGR
jgi:serine/threonine protein kinase